MEQNEWIELPDTKYDSFTWVKTDDKDSLNAKGNIVKRVRSTGEHKVIEDVPYYWYKKAQRAHKYWDGKKQTAVYNAVLTNANLYTRNDSIVSVVEEYIDFRDIREDKHSIVKQLIRAKSGTLEYEKFPNYTRKQMICTLLLLRSGQQEMKETANMLADGDDWLADKYIDGATELSRIPEDVLSVLMYENKVPSENGGTETLY